LAVGHRFNGGNSFLLRREKGGGKTIKKGVSYFEHEKENRRGREQIFPEASRGLG